MPEDNKTKSTPKRSAPKKTAESAGRKPKPPVEPTDEAPITDKIKGLQDLLKFDKDSLIGRLMNLPNMVDEAYRMAVKTTEQPLKVGKAMLLSPEHGQALEEAGKSLQDLREVAGLTRDELNDVLDLKDKSLLEAVESGTAILSFELILRLAAVLARHDPLPFIMKYTRAYKPELWQILDDWGLGVLYLNFEREREFINIYRRHDAVRKLSDEGFKKILDFTRGTFDMAIHFVAEQEKVEDKILSDAELNQTASAEHQGEAERTDDSR